MRPIDNIELVARIKTILRMKRAEDRLRAGKAELELRVARQSTLLHDYQRAVESTWSLVAVVKRDFTYHLVNEAFLHYYDLPREQVVGSSVAGMIGADVFATRIRPHLEQAFAGATVEFEMERSFPRLTKAPGVWSRWSSGISPTIW